MPLEIPQRLLQEFSLKQQTELRKIANLVYEAATADSTTFKYIEEQGEAEDSGTILSTSEIVATVASLDGDIVASSQSALLGGSNNTINGGNNAAIVGGNGNLVDGNSGTIVGGGNNTVTGQGVILGSEGSTNDSSSQGAVILGGTSHYIDSSGINSAIFGGSTSTVEESAVVVLNGGSRGFRRGGSFFGGGTPSGASTLFQQSCVMVGGAITEDASPEGLIFGSGVSNISFLRDTSASLFVTVTAVNLVNQDSKTFTHFALVKRIGLANVVVVSDNELDVDGDASLATASVAVVASGATASIQVTGIAATDISWSTTVIINEQQIVASPLPP